jgi:hypothetical protein
VGVAQLKEETAFTIPKLQMNAELHAALLLHQCCICNPGNHFDIDIRGANAMPML